MLLIAVGGAKCACVGLSLCTNSHCNPATYNLSQTWHFIRDFVFSSFSWSVADGALKSDESLSAAFLEPG
jgi:hypothetical protein